MIDNYIANNPARIQLAMYKLKENKLIHDKTFAALVKIMNKHSNFYSAAKEYVDSLPAYKNKINA